MYTNASGSKLMMIYSRMWDSILLWLYAMMKKDEKWF